MTAEKEFPPAGPTVKTSEDIRSLGRPRHQIKPLGWRNTDPRDSVNKRDTIVVCAPEGEVFKAEVETKHAWCVFLRGRGKDKLEHVGEEDEWPLEFFWVFAPRGW